MARTVAQDAERVLESRRGQLGLGLFGLALGIAGFQAGRRAEQHRIAALAARGGLVPDLRLYTLGASVRPAFRETLTGDLRLLGA